MQPINKDSTNYRELYSIPSNDKGKESQKIYIIHIHTTRTHTHIYALIEPLRSTPGSNTILKISYTGPRTAGPRRGKCTSRSHALLHLLLAGAHETLMRNPRSHRPPSAGHTALQGRLHAQLSDQDVLSIEYPKLTSPGQPPHLQLCTKDQTGSTDISSIYAMKRNGFKNRPLPPR